MRIHLIGIGGSGLSAIARVLLESGYTVSGSDRSASALLDDLAKRGANISTVHQAANVRDADLVVRSSAVPDHNPEVQEAHRLNIPVLKRSDFLEKLLAGKRCLAIAGTHGKTTTTAMLAWALYRLNEDPSYIIGGVSKDLGSNAHAGQGQYFVIEADEYDGMFLGLRPDIAIVTYMEHDHPDCYPTPQDYRSAFVGYIQRLQNGGTLLLCGDEEGAAGLRYDAPQHGSSLMYGINQAQAHYQAKDLTLNALGCYDFTARSTTPAGTFEELGSVSLQIPGIHNVRNALAVLAVIHRLKLSTQTAAQALSTFHGTGRRFDVRGEAAGVTIVDDYAHHPSEIRTTLAAARQRFAGRQLWTVWQPHTYSRTRTLLDDFMGSFENTDHLLITEIYAAREQQQKFSSAEIVARINHPSAHFMPTLEQATAFLLQHLHNNSALLVLSAGDAEQISGNVLAGLKEAQHG